MAMMEANGPTITQRSVPVWNDRLQIKVKIAGAGAPLLYLHPAAGLVWDPFLSHLCESYTVYAPEFPGTSAGDPYAIHAVDHLGDVVLVYEEVVRGLGLTKPIVIGQSFGGMLAAELASTFPDLASKVVLLDPLGLYRDDLPIANWLATSPLELPSLLFHDPDGPAATSMLAMPEDPDIAAAATAALVWALGCTAKFAFPIPDRGLRKRLHRLSAPVLLLWGRQDRLVPADYVEEWTTEVGDIKTLVLDNCGHIPQVEQLDQTLTAIEKFLT